jgi:hypothetical protein
VVDNKGPKSDLVSQMFFLLPIEGIDSLNQKVFETNHPYERSKVQQFDPKYFPGAIALSLEFDRKCQSD